jgi:hypothetical protein
MGHSDIDVTQNIYGKSWWEERVDAVSAAVDLFMATTEPKKDIKAERCRPAGQTHDVVHTVCAGRAIGAPTGAPAPIAVQVMSRSWF